MLLFPCSLLLLAVQLATSLPTAPTSESQKAAHVVDTLEPSQSVAHPDQGAEQQQQQQHEYAVDTENTSADCQTSVPTPSHKVAGQGPQVLSTDSSSEHLIATSAYAQPAEHEPSITNSPNQYNSAPSGKEDSGKGEDDHSSATEVAESKHVPDKIDPNKVAVPVMQEIPYEDVSNNDGPNEFVTADKSTESHSEEYAAPPVETAKDIVQGYPGEMPVKDNSSEHNVPPSTTLDEHVVPEYVPSEGNVPANEGLSDQHPPLAPEEVLDGIAPDHSLPDQYVAEPPCGPCLVSSEILPISNRWLSSFSTDGLWELQYAVTDDIQYWNEEFTYPESPNPYANGYTELEEIIEKSAMEWTATTNITFEISSAWNSCDRIALRWRQNCVATGKVEQA